LKRSLVTVINAHHEKWIDVSDPAEFQKGLPRLIAIWTQVAARFANASTSLLMFEVFNEPHLMSLDNLNALNAACIPAIRKTNPDRTILVGGLQFMNPTWILSNPNALKIPDSAGKYVGIEIHNYDPYSYAGPNPKKHSWGSPSDRAQTQEWMTQIQEWASSRKLAILYGEFGVTNAQSASTGRVDWYQFHRQAGLKTGLALAVWDDSGKFGILNRTSLTWNEPILHALLPSNTTLQVVNN